MVAGGTGQGAGHTSQENLAYVVLIAGAAAMGGFLFGYDTSVINGAVDAIQDRFEVSSLLVGFTVSSALLGSALGAWVAGGLADRHGRIRVMQLAAILFAVSAVGSALPFTVWDLTVWRLLGGVAIGIASVIAPTYIAEIAPAAYRGRLGSMQQLAIVLGIAASQLVNYAIAAAAGGARGELGPLEAWQWMLGVELAPALLYLLLTLTIPESPRFLVRTGRVGRARRILARVEGADESTVDDRIEEIRSALGSERRPTPRDLTGGRFGLLPIVWIGMGLSAFQQLVGINVIFYYSASLWQSVGIEESDSLLLSLFTSIVNIVGTFVAIALVDRVGRKPLLLVGSAGMTVALSAAAVAFSRATVVGDSAELSPGWGLVALVAASSFVLFFSLSWGVMVWVLLGEMFPLRIRAAAMAVATATQWIANWLVTVTFPSLRDWNLAGTYVMYAVFAALSFVFVLRWVRETKGKKLEEMG
ncbi:MFS transporter [Actinoalloteichus sp. AHMU CJ021]|uniref:MFS transporter, SP family, sugar:H+ symporter n=1 Tax=Actinoalloteichus caeruleus DSM 43889 TaxID=1120930 RepID=A0ABT1JLH0_ACTCY|nr:sugar porter family MFS transporter [Actinoalloteichus caeruleus]AUS78931.1 MFS transporter [Actinoalloteichus sp. AHMU CJ021]MCP2333139.1 MFS transporter, SP family, sugar:H+ symporter [Actinoalloteichus caeruleus DSM 43889]